MTWNLKDKVKVSDTEGSSLAIARIYIPLSSN